MKKSLMAVALFGAFAGVAHAQTAVQIYGTVDAGFIKRSGQTLNIGKRAANTLGFKGTEELGNGLKALFQLEIRYEPDTGTVEVANRPLFQGQSRVGLQGDFGMVRIGRGLTPYQETVGAYEPWHSLPTPAGFYTDLTVAGYNSAPLDPAGSGNNRWSNAFWYNSPANLWGGFQVNAAVATKENTGLATAIVGNGTAAAPQYPVGAEASANPFSLSATYNNGPASAMFGYERNAIETKVWTLGGIIAPVQDLKLMATYTRQDRGHTAAFNPRTKAWVLGATYAMGPGKVLAGYGQKHPDGAAKTKQFSLGYEYSLSKRTYLYVDASRKKDITTAAGLLANPSTVNHYDVGVNHSF
ncbi:porin [Massilia solisilvae]|uniref:Porin n=1 Tax=Massilia solisilvae TaxID=1811225 RepID=A0ABT2BNP7_9BURK|nr:porin [Massilia solisilvae]MCS0610102.1 porin [Massilia solisilvae]